MAKAGRPLRSAQKKEHAADSIAFRTPRRRSIVPIPYVLLFRIPGLYRQPRSLRFL